MDKTISLAIFAGGILLVIFGVSVSNSVSSDFSRVFYRRAYRQGDMDGWRCPPYIHFFEMGFNNSGYLKYNLPPAHREVLAKSGLTVLFWF